MGTTENIEKKIIGRLCSDLIAAGFRLDVDDGGDIVVRKSQDVDAIMAGLFSTEEDYLIVRDADDRKVGVVCLIHGNCWDVISDYTVRLEKWMKGANDVADVEQRAHQRHLEMEV